MLSDKNKRSIEKSKLHSRSKHQGLYNFNQLIRSLPELAEFVHLNKYNNESINFFDPLAVKALNKALLYHHYNIKEWDIPENYLCPPIPGRADYIHYIADLLFNKNIEFLSGKSYDGRKVKCLDIGVGANSIYPIIGTKEYGWSFVASDIDPIAIKSAAKIIEANPGLKKRIELRLQKDSKSIFDGIIEKNERFELTICNPPFHSSIEEANLGTLRKLSNLQSKKINKAQLNFGGQSNELIYEGGEDQFVLNMINQSKNFSTSCLWFTTLISKESRLKKAYKALKDVKAKNVKTIEMGQGNKKSRILAWTFLSKMQQNNWLSQIDKSLG